MTERDVLPWEEVGPEQRRQAGRAGMVVDLRRCIGCHACSVSCKTEHEVPLGGFRTRVRYLQRPDRPTLAFLPLLCMQCQDAPCLKACPTEALVRCDDGTITIAQERCCGNKACLAACPYDALYIDPQSQVADKCDFCAHRTEVGLDPACVSACPPEALRFGDLDDPEDPVARYARENGARPYRSEQGTQPSVLFVGLEDWMEDRSRGGVQLESESDEIIYERS
ncbi:MAG: 4Fe-4S dicluster domain-containing protein [Acidobacteriota bacterium]